MASGEGRVCERVMRSLPKWFGIEEAIVHYAKACETMETYVLDESGQVVGFIALNQRSPVSAEIHCMAVRPEFHGKGLGRALMDYAEGLLASRPIEFLQVKTLGPSRPNAEYERTRGFYQHMGFRPLEENDLWGRDNPCLIMVKHLACRRAGP
jgi:N-acetylglutamate synthase-like GNAT family acetyltransferase